jgi:DNA topoisomerase-1
MEAAVALRDFVARGDRPAKAHVRAALERAAGQLGNTVAICRKCYVHPQIIASYESGEFLLDLPEGTRRSRARFALSDEEKAVLTFLMAKARIRR